MKAIMISIRPQWGAKVLNGEKTIEVRKGTRLYKAVNKLIAEQGVAPMFIYCTKDNKNCLFDFREDEHAPYKFGCGKADKWYKQHYKLFNGKVVARFNVKAEEIEYGGKYNHHDIFSSVCYTKGLIPIYLRNASCLEYYDMNKYLEVDKLNGKKGIVGTAIHIYDLEIFDKPKELWQFKTPKMAERYKHVLEKAYEDDCEIGTRIAEGIANDDEIDNCVELTEMSEGYYGLQRAPRNGWCYIEI